MAGIKELVTPLLAGDLRTAQPLIDRLQELNDPRVYELLDWLCELREHARKAGQEYKDFAFDSDEERAFRLNESRFRAWATFSAGVRDLFSYEIHGMPDLAFLRTLGKEIESAKQAARLEKGGSEPKDYDEGMDKMVMDSIPNFGDRSRKTRRR